MGSMLSLSNMTKFPFVLYICNYAPVENYCKIIRGRSVFSKNYLLVMSWIYILNGFIIFHK